MHQLFGDSMMFTRNVKRKAWVPSFLSASTGKIAAQKRSFSLVKLYFIRLNESQDINPPNEKKIPILFSIHLVCPQNVGQSKQKNKDKQRREMENRSLLHISL